MRSFITTATAFVLTIVFLVSTPCVSSADTFPTGHPEGAVSETFTRGYGSSTDQFNIYMWREDYEVWIQIEIIDDYHPFICSSSFMIIQDSVQFDTVELLSVSDDGQCGDVFIDSVFKLSQWSFIDNPADLNHNFILLFDGGENTYELDMVYDHRPPVAKAGQDQTVNGNTTVTLDGSTSYDPDGDPITYHWETDTYLDITLSDANSMNPTFVAPEQIYVTQTITFELTVADGTFRTTDTVDIIIEEGSVVHIIDDDGGGGGGCFIHHISESN